MAGLIDGAKELLSIKIKFRHDSKFDQYSRIGMVKILMLSATVVAISWFSDKITCIVPDTVMLGSDFVSEACWIQGFYVNPNASPKNGLGYYGIPEDLGMDGTYGNGQMCKVDISDALCTPLEKTFYLQYQYMPFFLAALCVFYYVPYMMMTYVNKDLIELHSSLKEGSSADEIVGTFFKGIKHKKVIAMLVMTILVKVLYIVANVVGMMMCDRVLYGNFMKFGAKYATWSSLEHQASYDYTESREAIKPTNMLLPTFGICEVQESARDVRHTIVNRHKFVCEYSQHILYHYVLIILWYALVTGIVLAVLGLITKLAEFLANVVRNTSHGRSVQLNLRELEYMDAIQRKDMVLYGSVVARLKQHQMVKTEN